MRPIKLELTNFTIFRGHHSIDFSGLKFFIIQGRTGSGKTSLIDAICYALYGKVPRHGKENLSENIISKGTDRMNVFFEFSVRGKRYAVERFVNKGKAGVRLYENGKPKDIKLTQIPEFIKKVLGVDYETFTKVILLPQGQFDKFLRPERPQQRREILNKLLGMDTLLSSLSELIKETKRQMEGELTQVETALNELSYATKEELDRLQKYMQTVERELNSLNLKKEELRERLKTAIQRDRLRAELLECESELEELIKRKPEMESLERDLEKIEEATSYASYVESFRRLSKLEETEKGEIKKLEIELRKLSSEKEKVLKQLEEYDREWKKIGEYDAKIEELTREVERSRSALEKQREREKKLADLEQTSENLRIFKQKVEELKARIKRGEQFIEEKEAHIEALEEKRRRFLEFAPIKSKFDHVLREREALKRFLKENENLEEELRKVRENIKQKEGEILSLHVHSIRAHLKPGDVCPVCGNLIEKDFEEEPAGDLEGLKKELEELRERERRLMETKAKLDSMNLSLRQKEEELRELLGGMEEYEFEMEYEELKNATESIEEEKKTLKSAKDKLERLKEELNQKINSLSLEEAKRERLEKEIEEIENYLRDSNLTYIREEDLRKLYNELRSLRSKREEIRKNYTQLSDGLRAIELKEKEYQTSLLQKERNIENIKEEKSKISKSLEPAIKKFGSLEDLESYIKQKEHIKDLKNKIEVYKNRINLLSHKKGQLTEELKNYSHIEPTEEINLKLQNIEAEQKKYSVELGRLKEQKLRVEEGLIRKEDLKEQKKKLEGRLWVYSTLERDFRADRLQEFISQIMLQNIVGRANFYMQKFTSGAYEFELEGGDLEIIDKVSGHKRSVSTLSGGETFLASLSLAFGISDIISHNAPIESLFIDEGFGSLDRETREELSQFFELIKLNTDRVVGIISHLEDLAEKFDQRIEVIRRGDRSSVHVII
ncbi:SbcC/MukB-like Walker B domain-containing protein [Thermocrinis sp.]